MTGQAGGTIQPRLRPIIIVPHRSEREVFDGLRAMPHECVHAHLEAPTRGAAGHHVGAKGGVWPTHGGSTGQSRREKRPVLVKIIFEPICVCGGTQRCFTYILLLTNRLWPQSEAVWARTHLRSKAVAAPALSQT
jgi:hypothetical protein